MIDRFTIFKNHTQSLKEISKDSTNSNFMCDLNINAVNFDKVKEKYVSDWHLPKIPKSVDAFLLQGNKSVLIEFKNGYINKKEEYEVQEKMLHSLLIFCDITDETVSYTRKYLDFILVYNSAKMNNLKYIKDRIFEKAEEKLILFGLEKFETLYFDNVYTYDKAEFEHYINNIVE
ncbi:MAG: hypothetical protein ACOX3H_01130 [Saccharofermentanales bacterium]|jgi:hypothetical protein